MTKAALGWLSAGAPGVDGRPSRPVEVPGLEGRLAGLREDLVSKTYGHHDCTSRGSRSRPVSLVNVMRSASYDLDVMIFLDVVYNHFGPDGNYLTSYAPSMFRHDLETPWGAVVAPVAPAGKIIDRHQFDGGDAEAAKRGNSRATPRNPPNAPQCNS